MPFQGAIDKLLFKLALNIIIIPRLRLPVLILIGLAPASRHPPSQGRPGAPPEYALHRHAISPERVGRGTWGLCLRVCGMQAYDLGTKLVAHVVQNLMRRRRKRAVLLALSPERGGANTWRLSLEVEQRQSGQVCFVSESISASCRPVLWVL
jgi:hypothetical protein